MDTLKRPLPHAGAMSDDTTARRAAGEQPVDGVIADLLRGEGISQVFTYLSEDMMGLAARIDADDATTVIHTRHEQDAVAMADGYARHTKDIGCCVVGQGGAIGQAGSALVTARKRGSSVLVIVPEASRRRSLDNPTTYSAPSPGTAAKHFDQAGYLRDTIESVRSIRSPEVVIPVLEAAIRRLRLGQGPIAVQISQDVLNGTMAVPETLADEIATPTALYHDPETTVSPSPARVQEAVDRYLDADAARHPLVIVGRGAARPENESAIEGLAERMGAVLATTFRGKGFLPDHPFNVGTVGETGTDLAVEYASEADYVLALGAGLNPRTRDSGRLFRDEATVVQVDVDPAALGRYGPISLGVHGDALATVEAMNETLDEYDIHRADQLWTQSLERRIREHEAFADVTFTDEPGLLDPRQLVGELDARLPEDRVLVVDGGLQARWVYRAVDVRAPDHLICRGDFSTIGLSLPMGLGAAVGADEEKTCVVFCGDGSFLMHLPVINTAARYDVPVIFIVTNDDALAAEYHRLPAEDQSIARTAAPNLAEVASSLGAEAHRVTSIEELDELAPTLETRPSGPVVVECLVDRSVRTSI